jgi:hypothetical protein
MPLPVCDTSYNWYHIVEYNSALHISYIHIWFFYLTFLGGDRIIVRRRSLREHSECAVWISQNSGHIPTAQWGLPERQPHSGKKGSKGERKVFTHPPTA